MPGALIALLCAGLLARAARGQAEGAAAVDIAPPPPPPVPAVSRAPSGPRPRIHIYDLPDELTKPCHWFGCGRLTEEVRKSKARRPRGATPALTLCTASRHARAHMLAHRAQYFEPNPDNADFWWIPHMVCYASRYASRPLLTGRLDRPVATVQVTERDRGVICRRGDAVAVLERERRSQAVAPPADADVRPRAGRLQLCGPKSAQAGQAAGHLEPRQPDPRRQPSAVELPPRRC